MEYEMNNLSPQKSSFEQGLTQFGKSYLNKTGLPSDSKVAKAVAHEPIQRMYTVLTDFRLPDEIVQILAQALETLGLQLEPTKTTDPTTGMELEHHEIMTATNKIVLGYLDENIIQDKDPIYFLQFKNFGALLSEHYKSIFVFSYSINSAFAYKEVRRQWIEDRKCFEKVEFLLDDVIQTFKETDITSLVGHLQKWFGLSQETSDEQSTQQEHSFGDTELRQKLAASFDMDGLRTLCFDLRKFDLDYENLKGDTLEAKVISLILHFERQGMLLELIKQCGKALPKDEFWSGYESFLAEMGDDAA